MNRIQVYEYLLRIPKGKVTTYGRIARALGSPGAARAVGNILHRNPDGETYPCYKVVNNKGRLCAAYAFGGMEAQKRKLEAEGIRVAEGRVDLAEYLFAENEE